MIVLLIKFFLWVKFLFLSRVIKKLKNKYVIKSIFVLILMLNILNYVNYSFKMYFFFVFIFFKKYNIELK